MPSTSIYLDNNATTVIDPEVAAELHRLQTSGLANPASQHRLGRQALHLLEAAKESILVSVGGVTSGMSASQVILTSGGSEANNLALHAFTHQRAGLVILGSMEHPSLLAAAELSALCLNPVRLLPACQDGSYDLEQLSQWIEQVYSGRDSHRSIALVSLMLANNETGVLNDIAAVSRACKAYGIPVHCDIIQAVGKIDIDMQQLGVAAMTVNAHKVHGPLGVGALIVDASVQPRAVVVGGGQQLGWRAGTEPVALAAAMAMTLEKAKVARSYGAYDQVAGWRNLFEQQIMTELDFVRINGSRDCRLPQTSNLSFQGIDRQALQMALDLEGIACSTGSACASGSSRPSTSLMAMGLDPQRVSSALRFSLSRMNTEAEILQAAETICRVAKRLKR